MEKCKDVSIPCVTDISNISDVFKQIADYIDLLKSCYGVEAYSHPCIKSVFDYVKSKYDCTSVTMETIDYLEDMAILTTFYLYSRPQDDVETYLMWSNIVKAEPARSVKDLAFNRTLRQLIIIYPVDMEKFYSELMKGTATRVVPRFLICHKGAESMIITHDQPRPVILFVLRNVYVTDEEARKAREKLSVFDNIVRRAKERIGALIY